MTPFLRLNRYMISKYHKLIEKLKLDHKKYRELINKSHRLVEHILEMDDKIDEFTSHENYDEDIEQSHYETRDHYLKHLDDVWKELKGMGISMTKDEFHDLIDYQNIR